MPYADLDSVEQMLRNQDSDGGLFREFGFSLSRFATPTASTTSCGGITISRLNATFTVPTVSSKYTGWFLDCRGAAEDGSAMVLAGIEYDLGSLNISGNAFSAGSDGSMPTRNIRINGTTNESIQTASMWSVITILTNLSATTPTITTTYTNESGTGSRSVAVTLPTSAAAQSSYLLNPHLQSPDLGIQSVSNMSTSAGASGTMAVRGLLPLNWTITMAALTGAASLPRLQLNFPKWIALPGEKIAFYRVGSISTSDLYATITGIPI